MFLSNISGISNGMWGRVGFQVTGQKSAILQQNSPLMDVMSRMTANFQNAQGQRTQLHDRIDLYLAGIEGSGAESSALSELSDEQLQFYYEYFKALGRLNSLQESELVEYRDQLSAFDQTIQQYQEMLDGTAALPQQITKEQVQTILDATKTARDTFLQKGAEEVNRYTSKGLADGLSHTEHSMAQQILGPNGYEDKSADFWRIDPNAGDIYGEIDRVLTATHAVTQNYRRGMSVVAAELERRGYMDAPYSSYFEQQKAQAADTGFALDGSLFFMGQYVGNTHGFKEIYEQIWSDFHQDVRDSQ